MRYTRRRVRINRRFAMSIFPPGNTEERKPCIPGMHEPHLRRKVSDYSVGLMGKQKVCYMYGLTERQFRLNFNVAQGKTSIMGVAFLNLLALRLDNVIYHFGIAGSRTAARQFVTHGDIRVNGKS